MLGRVGLHHPATDPEYLLGISTSIAHQHLFIAGGAYIGRQQSLDGDFTVGAAKPTPLTGDLPMRKQYSAGFGFVIADSAKSLRTLATRGDGLADNT